MSTDVHEVTELITPGPAQALAGLLGGQDPGEELPLLWHLVHLLDRPPQDALGRTGTSTAAACPCRRDPRRFGPRHRYRP